jgi:hypothetical protein
MKRQADSHVAFTSINLSVQPHVQQNHMKNSDALDFGRVRLPMQTIEMMVETEENRSLVMLHTFQ